MTFLIAGLVALAGAAVQAAQVDRPTPARSAVNCGFPKADPRTLDEAWARVPLIVMAEVTSSGSRVAELPPRSSAGRTTRPEYRPVLDYRVSILGVFKEGGPQRASDSIRIAVPTETRQVGSTTEHVPCSSIPTLAVGQQWILFLYWSETFQAYTIAGRTGAFEVQGYRVILNDWAREIDFARGRAEMPRQEFLDALRRRGSAR
jgi:hypothetical protein